MANEYNFKPITAAEYLEEVPEGASVLVETAGEIKRVPGDGLGGRKTVVIVMNTDVSPTEYSANVSLDDAHQALTNGEFLDVFLMSGHEIAYSAAMYIYVMDRFVGEKCIQLSFPDNTLYWMASGITTSDPSGEG